MSPTARSRSGPTLTAAGDAEADGDDSVVLVERVARLFYEEQLTKVEIASRLAVSRFRVARLLDRALAEGVVRIEFRGAPAQDRALGAAVAERYGVRRAVVSASDDPNAMARLAAEVVDGLLEPGDATGIAWGSTVARVVRAMPVRADPSIEIVQLAGSSPRLDVGADPGDLTRVLAERLGAAHQRIHAPAFVDTPALRSALIRQPDVAATIDRFASLALALVGVGSFASDGSASSSLVRSGALSKADTRRLVRLGAVGDLIVHPFTADGAFVSEDLAERAIAIGIDELRRVPTIIAVAGGPAKVDAIRGALATGVIGVLVTTAGTARALAT
jgi:DNA-binding transcriptional regulator LsrR (DeoR family)